MGEVSNSNVLLFPFLAIIPGHRVMAIRRFWAPAYAGSIPAVLMDLKIKGEMLVCQ